MISRRDLVTRAGLGFLAAPLLARRARAAPPRKLRFITVFTPIGQMDQWLPTGTGAAFQLSGMAASLEPFKRKLMVMRGLRSALTINGRNFGGHPWGIQSSFTGAPSFDDVAPYARGLSIDQHIANAWRGQTPVHSLRLGVVPTPSHEGVMSYAGPQQPLFPERSAARVFSTLFQGAAGSPADVERIRLRRQSVLDRWTGELNALRTKLDGERRTTLDAQLAQIRAVETQLASPRTCSTAPFTNPDRFYSSATNFPAIGKQMIDLTVSALACDLTRVVSLLWSGSGSHQRHPWATAVNQDHHAFTHAADAVAADREVAKVYQWYTEQFAYLLAKLDAIPEDGGTMLDNTVVLWTSELGSHRSHSGFDMRVVVAGNANAYFKTGSYYPFPGLRTDQQPLNNLLAELATGVGVPTEKFGDPTFATGQLPAIRAR